MSLASSPATGVAGTKPPIRTRRSNRHNGQPAAPMAPPSGQNYGKRAKGVEIDLAELFESAMPPLPDTLQSPLRDPETAGQAKLNPRDILDAPDTADFIFGAIAAGVAFNDIDKALKLATGTVNGWLVSDPQNLTRTSLSLVSAADLFDTLARRLLAGLKGAPKATQLRVTLSAANSARCQAEGWRRLSESLGRKVTVLADHREVQRKEATAKMQNKAAKAAIAEEDARARRVHETIEAEHGAPLPPPREIIQPLGTPMSQDEYAMLSMYDNTRAVKMIRAEDAPGLQALADQVRMKWMRQHGEIGSKPNSAVAKKKGTTAPTTKHI
jgi:hypothetical protein